MKRYPAYKDSGVEWLGMVPEGWEVHRVNTLASVVNGYPFDSKLFDAQAGIPLVRIRDLNRGETETKYTGMPIASALVTSDDVLIGMDGDFNVGRWRGAEPALLNQRMCCIRSASPLLTRFIEYCLPAPLRQINDVTYATTVKHLSSYQVEKIRIARPSHDDDLCAIVDFLDRETAKIDALVEEQRRLIALLAEKRQAVISHAVTKGLNPDAPLKPSGIDWLGDIPEGWEVVPTGYRYEVQLGRMLNEARTSGDHLRPYLRVFDVQWGQINIDDLPLMDFPPDAQERYRLESGDLIVNEGGSYVGRSAIWRAELDECYYQKALHRLRPRDVCRDTAEYFYFIMDMATRRNVFVAGGNQTTIDHLTAEQLRAYRFAFPPLDEQLGIAEYLQLELPRFDALTEAATSAIALLQERRAALISAAVTGKIDLRDEAALVQESA